MMMDPKLSSHLVWIEATAISNAEIHVDKSLALIEILWFKFWFSRFVCAISNSCNHIESCNWSVSIIKSVNELSIAIINLIEVVMKCGCRQRQLGHCDWTKEHPVYTIFVMKTRGSANHTNDRLIELAGLNTMTIPTAAGLLQVTTEKERRFSNCRLITCKRTTAELSWESFCRILLFWW